MTHTITRRRVGRLAAGLTVAAAATLLGAAPAYAQGAAVTAHVTNGTLFMKGTDFGDIITASGGSTITLSNLTGSIKADGAGCTNLGAVVRCTGVNRVSFSAGAGNDKYDGISTSVTTGVSGGSGNDILIGGSGNDRLSGGIGTDRADGRGGTDTCFAETETSCEL